MHHDPTNDTSNDAATVSAAADTTERPARPGETCTCGRRAIVVYVTETFGDVGYCGIPDGGDRG